MSKLQKYIPQPEPLAVLSVNILRKDKEMLYQIADQHGTTLTTIIRALVDRELKTRELTGI